MDATLKAKDIEVRVRPGTSEDVPVLLAFIRSMAAFERLEVSATEASLREALFGESPAARTLLVFSADRPVGYLTYFFTFATMTGRRGLWLDDLFIDPAFRGRGIGRALMRHLAGVAIQEGCARFEWMVLDWNAPALAFYRRLGARTLEDWRICRLAGDDLARLVDSPRD
jgi:GNAT superfamily N-acetyltransferase